MGVQDEAVWHLSCNLLPEMIGNFAALQDMLHLDYTRIIQFKYRDQHSVCTTHFWIIEFLEIEVQPSQHQSF